MVSPRPQVLCLAGPTASGKSAAALRLATVRPIEIVSVDSAQVYRGMDIGTAKPTAAERAAVPHHLIDIRGIADAYSAVQFAHDALSLIGQIRSRGRLPVLVGGTMLYFKALWGGLDEIPAGNLEQRKHFRERIEAEAAEQGWPALHARLARVDPATAARLAPHDAQRIERALEVWTLTGRPLSSFHSKGMERAPGPSADMLLVSLEPASRAWLHRRIDERFEQMMREGLPDEVRRLRGDPAFSPSLPSMRCVGYRQLLDALGPENEPLTGAAWQAAVAAGQAATRQLAKRQLTWLRGIPSRHVIASDGADPVEAACRLVHEHIGAP